MTREFIDFVKAHESEDTARLLLSAARYPHINMPLAVQQIEGRRMAKEKWPDLLAHDEYLYPPRLNREQASSQKVAARRTQDWLQSLEHTPETAAKFHVADLTGGMGIDAFALAGICGEVDYVERDPQLCTLMKENCRAMETDNIRIHQSDSMSWLQRQADQHKVFDLIYIDPARRDNRGRKMVGFESCEPNIFESLPLILRCCRTLMVKASPMIDIDHGCNQLKQVRDVNVYALNGECKEVVFVCAPSKEETRVNCVDIHSSGNDDEFCFTRSMERESNLHLAGKMGRYIYEPNAAIMKAGPYALLTEDYEIEALAPNTHLYTSDEVVADFPGRSFEVLSEIKLSRSGVASMLPDGKAHVITRNYPVGAAELQRQLGLKEGGEQYIVATTVGNRPCGFLCARF